MPPAKNLALKGIIGFKSDCRPSMILHPDQNRLIYALGSFVVIRYLKEKTQQFLTGHDEVIGCIACSKDGKYIASGQVAAKGLRAEIITWESSNDSSNFNILHRLSLHKGGVQAINFSPCGKYLGSIGGDGDRVLVIWCMISGDALCGSSPASTPLAAISFFNISSDSLITIGDTVVRLWKFNESSKKLTHEDAKLGILKRNIACMCISPDDSYIYCGTTTGDVLEISNTGIHKRICPSKGLFSGGISSLASLLNGDFLLGTGTGKLAMIDISTMKIMSQCDVSGRVTAITLANDNHSFFVTTDENNFYWCNNSPLRPLEAELRNTGHRGPIYAVSFPSNFSDVFATCGEGNLRLWSTKDLKEVIQIEVPTVICYCLDFSHDGKYIVSGWSDGKIRAHVPKTGRLGFLVDNAHSKGGVTALRVSEDGVRIVSGGMSGEVRVWKALATSDDKPIFKLEVDLNEHKTRIYCIRIHWRSSKALSASSDGSCIIWDLETFTRSLCLFDTTMFKSVAIHPDGTQVITVGSDRKIVYWDAYDGESLRILEGSFHAELNALDISLSGSHIIVADSGGCIKIWNYEEAILEYQANLNSTCFNDLSISPDQKLIVAVDNSGGVFLWEVPSSITDAFLDTSEL